MAPSRRKGASKAAATAAARRKWKVGDLVLAKVKGFPAWPASVSEAEKWGYTADRKKVVVHFFGSQQIAFCNPADVEEFTEEKKVSLLGKRHGKGADFVRAVKEIVECFEKLKKLDQQSSANGSGEIDIGNESNSEESLTKSVKDEAPEVTVKACSTGTTNDLNSLTEAAVAAAANDALHGNETELTHPNSVPTEEPVCTPYSRRSKVDVSRSRNSGSQRRKFARRLRSSSRIDANRLQRSMQPANKNTRSSRRLGANSSQDRSLRRSKRIMKSSDDSEGHDLDSTACVSNDSMEESESERMSVDSDMYSANDGSTMDRGCKPVGVEPFGENNEGETELSDRFDFQSNAVIIKKKRKPNRKRHADDTVAAKLNPVASDTEGVKTESFSPSNNEKLAHTHAKDDGDDHLPLLKRARVRMSRPSLAGEEEATLLHKEEEILEASENLVIQSSETLSYKVDAPADAESFPNKGYPSNSSLMCETPAKKPQFWETRKNFVDGEAALPPSKRLHRALEAMSANVAKDCERASNCSQTANSQSNGYSTSSLLRCSELPMGNRDVIELGEGAVENPSNGDARLSVAESSAVSNMEVSGSDEKTSVKESDREKTCIIVSRSPEFSKDSSEHLEAAECKHLKMSRLNGVPAEIDAEHDVKRASVNSGDNLAHLDFCTPGPIASPADHHKTEHFKLNETARSSDPHISQLDSEAVLVEDIYRASVDADNGVQIDKADGEDKQTPKIKHLKLAENNQDSKTSEFVEEPRPASIDSNSMLSVAPVKVLTVGHHRLSHSNSISGDRLEDTSVSVTRSSSRTDGTDSVVRASPPSSSICNISAPENNNSHENNSFSSPDVQLHLEKAKLAGKSGCKGESLSSFEAILKSLTRTKESIGRATRIAIDCAKSGFASKVVEILASNLETESSLHKKVDLFFLVDSITQCSRGMKGDEGVYPSAIQALLPRLLLAAAPPGSNSHENHRQCLKVLRLWQERKILPEPIIRHHIRELDTLCGPYTGGSRRPLRNERAFDDPIRQMEGMLVDEYGSNSSIQLPGFCMPPMLRDDDGGSDSDGESFEAVTPEHNVENLNGEKTHISAVEKRSHILEDVDGELEMEDVAPCCDVEITSTSNVSGADSKQMSHNQIVDSHNGEFTPQQRKDVPLGSAPLPKSPLSPPPPPPPPPHLLPPSVLPPAVSTSVSNGPGSKLSSSSQNFKHNVREPNVRHSVSPRVKPRNLDAGYHRFHDSRDFESQIPRKMPDPANSCSFNDRPTSHSSGRASNSIQPTDAFGKGFHLRPPHPAPSDQFSYVQERVHSRRDAPPPSYPNRFHGRNAENGNFYRDRDRNKFPPRDDIGECWRPPYPSISGPCYHDDGRMSHAPMSYNGPPREPPIPNNRWNGPPRPMNHRHFNSYRPPSEGPISVANRGPHFWRPR